MKASSALFIAIAVAIVLSVALFCTQKPLVAGVSPPAPTAAPGESELQKTEASLKRIEGIRFASSLSPERLLPQRAETAQSGVSTNLSDDIHVFPSFPQDRPAGANRLAGRENANPAESAAAGSGYGNSIAGPVAGSAYQRPAASAPGRAGGGVPAASARGRAGLSAPAGQRGAGSAGLAGSVESAVAGSSYEDLAESPEAAVAEEKINAVSLTYVSPGFRRAVVDSELVSEGKRLPDGAVVSSIRKGSVVLTRDRKRYEVPVPGLLPKPPEQDSALARDGGQP
jgi:hypothetical protein